MTLNPLTPDQRDSLAQAVLRDSLRAAPNTYKAAYGALLAVVNNSRNTQDAYVALAALLSSANEIDRAVQAVAEEDRAAEVTGTWF